jgi:hypothetical protein
MDRLILILLFSLTSLVAGASESPKSVFVHASCEGKISGEVLSSLREGIRTSQKYQLARKLDNGGRMDIVLTIYMSCTERNDVAAVATSYGFAKCYGEKNCHLSVDGHSIKSTLCDAKAATECGRGLFKAFDDYMNSPNGATFKLN